MDHHGLPHRADKRLPEITGLIDPEQFDLITRPSEGFLVIRGTAGSGKTTVALHRIAYLAYDDPEFARLLVNLSHADALFAAATRPFGRIALEKMNSIDRPHLMYNTHDAVDAIDIIDLSDVQRGHVSARRAWPVECDPYFTDF